MNAAEIEELSKSLQSLTPAQKLFLSAMAMERARPEIAVAIAMHVVLDYDAAKLVEELWRQAG